MHPIARAAGFFLSFYLPLKPRWVDEEADEREHALRQRAFLVTLTVIAIPAAGTLWE